MMSTKTPGLSITLLSIYNFHSTEPCTNMRFQYWFKRHALLNTLINLYLVVKNLITSTKCYPISLLLNQVAWPVKLAAQY